MRICCIADLHGHLPEVPDCDLLLLAGDYCPVHRLDEQAAWIESQFAPWLGELTGRMVVVGVAGNHDFLWESAPGRIPPLPWTYLEDSVAMIDGLVIWGSPFSNRFGAWAFMAEERDLEEKWAAIPDDVDIVITHGPPLGCGDFVPWGPGHRPEDGDHVGSTSLAARIGEVRPRLAVCGHIHCGHGRYAIGATTVINAAHVGEDYRPAHPPEVIEIEFD